MNTSKLTSSEKIFVDRAEALGITNPLEIAQLLAQVKHESGLRLVDEKLNYSADFLLKNFSRKFSSRAAAEAVCCGKDRAALAEIIYGNRKDLGNTSPGDGFKYRGRGYIQLTGKANYAAVGKKLGIDLINNPDLVLDPRYAADVAIQVFWKDRVRPRVNNFADTTAVTKAVNGGDIGLADRQQKFKYYADTLGVSSNVAQGSSPTPPPKNTPAPVPPTVQNPIPQQPLENYTAYLEKNYKNPFKNAPIEVQREVLYTQTNASEYYRTYLGNLKRIDYSKSGSIDYLVALDRPDMEGDLFLIDSLVKKQEKQTQETKSILDNKLGSFSPDAKLMLIASSLFEMYPDDMRNKMSQNSTKGGMNPNYSHAWRTPGKLSVTADLTIPGIAGLRIGQIFWVDRISDSYKDYGAFQLFGLTENIDISKGWTTSIHSRFNVLPRNSGGGKYLIDSDTVSKLTKTLTGITTNF